MPARPLQHVRNGGLASMWVVREALRILLITGCSPEAEWQARTAPFEIWK